MNENVHRFLDGEISADSLSPREADEARQWREWLSDMGGDQESAPPWLETAVMAGLPDDAPAPAWQQALRWLFRPRQIQIRPATVGLAAAAVLAVIMIIPGGERLTAPPRRIGGMVSVGANAAKPHVYVRFQVRAPNAASVTVAGDFNGWSTTRHVLRDADADGDWSGLVPLTPGVHKYMFVVNGEKWITDPSAQRYMDDGFGMRNAMIAVSPPTAWRSS